MTTIDRQWTPVHLPDVPPPAGAYSPGVKAGPLFFVSGQTPRDPATGQVVGTTIEEQTRVTLANVERILRTGGASLADVVQRVTGRTVDDVVPDAFVRSADQVELVDISRPAMGMRMVKSDEEIALIRHGARIADIGGAACVEASATLDAPRSTASATAAAAIHEATPRSRASGTTSTW